MSRPNERHDPERFYHCDCLEEGTEHDDRFYHCDCLEGGYDPPECPLCGLTREHNHAL